MTPEERTLLSDLFRHLREVETQPRDAEAEAFIRQSVQGQPLSSYYMAQTVLVQQQAMTAAQTRIEDLERQLKEAQTRAPQPAPSSGGSFLSNALGLGRSPWGARNDGPPSQPPAQASPARSPWGAPQAGYAPPPGAQGQPGYYPSQPYAPQGGGGFLAGAAQTAAGVAGGMLAASAISSLLSHSPGPFGGVAGAAAAPVSETVNETVINNFYGNDPAANARDVSYTQDADYQSDDSSFDGGGDSDSGGDDSWT